MVAWKRVTQTRYRHPSGIELKHISGTGLEKVWGVWVLTLDGPVCACVIKGEFRKVKRHVEEAIKPALDRNAFEG